MSTDTIYIIMIKEREDRMLVKLLEPLNVSETLIKQLAQPIVDKGHDFVYYGKKTTDTAELVERSKGADVVMIANNPYPLEAINENKNLKLINVAFTGIDHVALTGADNQEILICNAAGYANQAVAELAIGLVIDLYRHISEENQSVRSNKFSKAFQGSEIKGKTVGIIGLGKIGLATARLFKAFGAHVIATKHTTKSPVAEELGIEYKSQAELLKTADIVSLHVPLNEATKNLISAKELSLMKDSAILINCARGPVVDNDQLADALNEGKIAGAGIDVFDMEPPIPADYKLLTAKNTILTPHVGFLTNEAMEIRAQIAFDNTLAYLAGDPQNLVKR